MSINIELSEKQLNNSQNTLQMHFIPAKITGDGEANVDKFFDNYTNSEQGFMRNALRGYPLQGVEKAVPPCYRGVVLQESRKPLDKTAQRQLRVTGCFERFNYWNYDKIPSKADPYTQSLQYLEVSQEVVTLAKPITEDEVLAEMKKNREEREAMEPKPAL